MQYQCKVRLLKKQQINYFFLISKNIMKDIQLHQIIILFYLNIRNELASSAASQKLQIITRVRNLATIQQGGPAKLSTYKMRTLHNGQKGDQSNISDSTINSSRESKV